MSTLANGVPCDALAHDVAIPAASKRRIQPSALR